MGTLKDAQRTLAIMACIVLIGALLIVLFTGCSSIDPATRYANQTKEYSYQYWERSQISVWQKVFGKGKDPRITFAEKQVRDHERFKKRNQKEAEIVEQVQAIKAKLNNQ